MENQAQNNTSQWTILKLLGWTTAYFKSRRVEGPRAAAEILLAHVLGLRRIDLYVCFDQPLTATELTRFKAVIKRRALGEPVAYIVGHKEFWSLELTLNGDVLIPRPETECLVEAVLSRLKRTGKENNADKPRRILELGTGSGAITLALAAENSQHVYLATDVSGPAVRIARKNAMDQGFSNIMFLVGNWLDPLNTKKALFDIILSNPPYIRTSSLSQLQAEISQYEPRQALDGGSDGLRCHAHILRRAGQYLNQGGWLLLEIGHDQKEDIQKLGEETGQYCQMAFKKDYHGHQRVVEMMKI